MGLKWTNEEDEAVEPRSIPDAEAYGVEIDGEAFVDDDGSKFIYEESFKGFVASDLPEAFTFELVNYFDHNGAYESGRLPFEITKSDGALSAEVLDFAWPHGRSQDFDPVDVERLQLTRRVVGELCEHEDWIRGVAFDEDDERYGGMTLKYEVIVPADMAAEDAFGLLLERYSRITDRVEALLGQRSLGGILSSGDERLFTREVVMPALEAHGMLDVRYVHGTDEHGRDILYRYQHPLGFEVLGAVQCKAGDVTGRAGQKVDEIIAQIQDAFAFPVYDLNTKSERPVCEVIVAVSGDFRGTAVQRIRHRLPSPVASRVWFWSAKDFRDMRRRAC